MNQTELKTTGKQRQIPQSTDLARSFKTTTNLAQGLIKERVIIQNELQKIGQTKSLLEEMRIASKSKKAEPILTVEEKASKQNKAEIKGTGFQMKMIQSLKGADMIENQRDTRRQRHIICLKECEKFVEQFYDNFSEKKNEIQDRIKMFFERSDIEIEALMAGLTDELLLANEIGYVNGIWEKATYQRNQRNQEVLTLREKLDNLKAFQQKGSGSYIGGMRQKLIDIAFYLEPQVDELMKKQISDEEAKYKAEHQECDEFYNGIVSNENEKFDNLYQIWKESVVNFLKLKQEDAIKKFVDRLNSKEFVNPESRVEIFSNIKIEQEKIYNQRIQLIDQLNDTHPRDLTKELVSNIHDSLTRYNEESCIVFDGLVHQLTKDMENTAEDINIALYDLKDFIIKNDAHLEENQTFDLIIEKRAQPYVDARKHETHTLFMNAIAYQEDFDGKMTKISENIVTFFREYATCLDKNKDKLKQTEINFQVALANCGDHHDDITQGQEDDLAKKILEMERSIHHVMLNDKLQECFDLLDQIQRTYRNYNEEYIKIAQNYPNKMDQFYEEFEQDSYGVFKRFHEDQRERVIALFTQETDTAQMKLEAGAMAKWEAEKKAEESKALEEAKKAAADPKAKKAAPAKGKAGKEGDKPNLNIEKLVVPTVVNFESKMNQKYIFERTIEEISQKLLNTSPLEEEQNPQGEDGEKNEAAEQKTPTEVDQRAQNLSPLKDQVKGAPVVESQLDENADVEEEPEDLLPADIVKNDYIEKANLLPPKDPEGENCLHPDLILLKEKLIEILSKSIEIVMDWLVQEKQVYHQKCQIEGRQLQDQSVEELDENLRKQWPRKGRLEVEIFQERKSQITNHNRKYDRQVRACLEKYNNLEEEWSIVLDKAQEEFDTFAQQVAKLKGDLPLGKNLAQLQGTSRREKDAAMQFEEKCRELREQLDELSYIQPDYLIKNNNDMLQSCQLFETGGNYDTAEIEWYQQQMDEINQMINTCKESRAEKVKALITEIDRLLDEPEKEFNDEYKVSIEELSAKDGLGKTYGQPRRFAQERLRSEMTKCEEAQKGVDKILSKLQQLCQLSFEKYGQDFDYSKEKQSLSIEIRVNLVSLVRMMIHYGKHLGGFKQDAARPTYPEDLPRISYRESQDGTQLQESEVALDQTRREDELEHLGPIGFKNSNEEYKRFPEAIQAIDQTCRDLVTKLYTGENAKHLVGDQKIPEYLSIFLQGMHRQVEEFKINCVRQLRTSSEQLVETCQLIPKSVFRYIQFKYESIVLNEIDSVTAKFQQKQKADSATKEAHLQLFKPNLANPANKESTKELNEKELSRSTVFRELVDDTQFQLLTVEEEKSKIFQTAYLNNVRSLVAVFDKLLPKTCFIMLPGDEIVEKKHANIKMLTAQQESADLSKKLTRKWPGLGHSVFDVDYEAMFDAYRPKAEAEDALSKPGTPAPKEGPELNEISGEVEVQNTAHHKAIVKARNEYYILFQQRFQQSIKSIMGEYDSYRTEDIRFAEYWSQNLKEITQKHI